MEFEITSEDGLLKVRRVDLAGQTVFHILFPDPHKKPLIITRALNADAAKFWTSVPQGRQPEAEKIGPLIDDLSCCN